jgi:hypothetical protein
MRIRRVLRGGPPSSREENLMSISDKPTAKALAILRDEIAEYLPER